MKEGAWSSRMFFHDGQFADNIHREIELDVEYVILNISKKYKHCIEEIAGKPGFLRISMNKHNCSCHDCVLNVYEIDIQQMRDHYEYAKPFYTKQRFNDLNGKNCAIVQFVLAIVCNLPFNDVKVVGPHNKITKATFSTSYSIFIREKLQRIMSGDLAIIVKLNWISTPVQEWIKTKQGWPPLSLITNSIRESYIIAKTSREEKPNQDATEWRYSFARIEHRLISLHSMEQRIIYLVFKSMFYKWLKPIDELNLDSFLAKTTMFWVCARYPPDSSYWRVDRHSMSRVLIHLLSTLRTSFQRKFFPYYFIPEINIIEHIPLATNRKVALQLLKMMLDVERFVPRNIQPVIDFVRHSTLLFKDAFILVKMFEESLEDAIEHIASLRPDLLTHIEIGNAGYNESFERLLRCDE